MILLVRKSKPFIICLSLLLIAVSLPACSRANEYRVEFSRSAVHPGGTVLMEQDAAVFDNSMRNGLLTLDSGLEIPLKERGILELSYRNTSSVESIELQFVTLEDPEFTSFKSVVLPIAPSGKFAAVRIDVSGQYGWLGTLTGLRVSCEAPADGRIEIRSLDFLEGGTKYPPLDIGPEEIAYTFKDRAGKGIGMSPDGILGQWRNSDGTITFIGSNMGKVFQSIGTETDPFQKVLYTSGVVENVSAADFRYASIAQVVRDPDSDLLVGITHLEKTLDSTLMTYEASIALSVSRDGGDSWQCLGEVVSCNLPPDQKPGVSRDAGNGTIVVRDGYLYIYITDMDNTTIPGFSVSRAPLSEIFTEADNDRAAAFSKWYEGSWSEPGLQGRYTNILNKNDHPNFCYIQFNAVINKYIMVKCSAPYYSANDGDIMVYFSDSLTDFTSPGYYVATGKRGEQYPTLISMEQDSQGISGKEFYLYYCSWNAKDETGKFNWQALWGSSNYIRRKITIKDGN